MPDAENHFHSRCAHSRYFARFCAPDQQWAGLEGNDPADEKGKDAYHQQAGVANLEELVEHLLALAPRQRQSRQRPPEQQDHLSDVLKHKLTVKESNKSNRLQLSPARPSHASFLRGLPLASRCPIVRR